MMLSISAVLNLATWIWLFWQIKPGEQTVFLHYNILFGADYVGPRWQIMVLPLTGLLILIVNVVLGWVFYNRDKFISHMLNGVSVFCQATLLLAACLLVFLNV